MTRLLTRLGAVLAAVLTLAVVPIGPASAAPSDLYGCRIAPGFTFTFNDPCHNDKGASSYGVAFAYPDLQGVPGYTFSWTITGGYTAVFAGCTSADYFCNVTVPNVDRTLTGTGTFSGPGGSGSRTATAVITRLGTGGGPTP